MSSSRRSALNRFTALELDRCSDRRDDPSWLRERWSGDQCRAIVVDSRLRVLMEPSAPLGLGVLRADSLRQLDIEHALFLGCRGDQTWFALPAELCASELSGQCGEFMDLRQQATRLSGFDAGLAAYARGMMFWGQRTRFCSACGQRLRVVSAGHRRVCPDSSCRLDHFPRTDPAIITIVACADQCLLGRQASWPPRRYSTLAGFVEPGESLEDALRREVMEEAGVAVNDCEYHSSQPWPFPASLMLGFTAHAACTELRLGDELEDARWFNADQMDAALAEGSLLLPPPVSVSFQLIAHWYFQQTGRQLPDGEGVPA